MNIVYIAMTNGDIEKFLTGDTLLQDEVAKDDKIEN
jgi:hypothetical protein